MTNFEFDFGIKVMDLNVAIVYAVIDNKHDIYPFQRNNKAQHDEHCSMDATTRSHHRAL